MSDVSQNEWDELKLLQDTAMKIWSMYVNWFTWSLGANLLAISWIIASKTDPKPELIVGLGIVMSIALALSLIGCFRARRFFEDMETRARHLTVDRPNINIHLIFGGVLARSASMLIPATLLVVLLAWILLICKYAVGVF